MFRKSTTPLLQVSQPKNITRKLIKEQDETLKKRYRAGQLELFKHLDKYKDLDGLNIKWPGGYGKSAGIAIAFRKMIEEGRCSHLLLVVANNAQKRQMVKEFNSDLKNFAFIDGKRVKAFSQESRIMREIKKKELFVIVATIHQISSDRRGKKGNILSMLQLGDFMLAADEYHHYADDMDWGESLRDVKDRCKFSLATSATPDRDGNATIFGSPDLIVTYSEAVAQGAVKDIMVENYEYSVDVVDSMNNVSSYTTTDLREKVGAAQFNNFEHKKGLRYQSDYILPIIQKPLERLGMTREKYGNLPLQCLIRSMSVAHAEFICKQIKDTFTGYSVDWVGTKNELNNTGRSKEENDAICEKFRPDKDEDGFRPHPTLDILVQVGIAGEGFDSVLVSEIIDFALVTLDGNATQTKQFYYRGTRAVDNVDLYINIPSDHPLAAKPVDKIKDWFDDAVDIKSVPDMTKKEMDEEKKLSEERRERLIESLNEINFQRVELVDVTGRVRQDITLKNMSDVASAHVSMLMEKGDSESIDKAFLILDILKNQKPCEDSRDSLLKIISPAKEVKEDAYIDNKERRGLIDVTIGKVCSMYLRLTMEGSPSKDDVIKTKRKVNSVLSRTFGKRSSLTDGELERMHKYLEKTLGDLNEGVLPKWA